ncbi:MAG: 5-formyltetrahydrofolate cyclo-ligase [Verrucomicrobia bacterium]|nr:5-formyltetrahydrofolate cyclo-ligase [Verrucomicrobiota bacterium]MBV8375418.1 5-formyltetrahydrofolate cyclo-ligase [Verrucomicrobiota bacterium]
MANPRSQFSDKSCLRRLMRERLKLLSPDERHLRSVRTCEKLRRLLGGRNSIGLFAPTLAEPDLDLLWDLGLLKDHRISYPSCKEGVLSFHSVLTLSELIPGRFGIRESVPGPRPEKLDLILVPGLAFTADGSRLGRGAGFYDKFLSGVSGSTVKIGVCFEFQCLSEIPQESHDVKMDAVVCS